MTVRVGGRSFVAVESPAGAFAPEHVYSSSSDRTNKHWILLEDNQSTVDLFMNKHLLYNINTVDSTMMIKSTSRKLTTN